MIRILIFALFFLTLALAQDYDRIKPREVESSSTPSTLSAPTSIPVPASTAPLVPKLKELVFLSSLNQLQPEGWTGEEGLIVRELPLFLRSPQHAKAAALLGQPVTLSALNTLFSEIIANYDRHDIPVVDVVLPEQDVSNGIIQIVVIEGRLGSIVTRPEPRYTPVSFLQKSVRVEKGEVISSRKLLNDLDWLNRNPFRRVDGALSPGSEVGTSDIVLQVNEKKAWRTFTGWDNSGNDLTGDQRLFAGANWGHAFGLTDSLFNYQFTANPDIDRSRSHTASYILPLPWRHQITTFGSYSDSKANSQNFLIQGASWQTSLRYEIPLPTMRCEQITYSQQIFTGFDYKQSTSQLDFGIVNLRNTSSGINNFVLGYGCTLRDPWGSSNLTATGFYSPGGLAGNNDDTSFRLARAGSSANYLYGQLAIDRTTLLPAGFTWINRLTRQFASNNLLASEQLSLGGYQTIRGYEENEVTSDQGYIYTTELRTPAFSPGKLLGIAKANDSLLFLGFWDYGVGDNVKKLLGENKNIELSSAGPGLRYNISPYVSLRLDYGFQLLDTGANSRGNSKGTFGLTLSY